MLSARAITAIENPADVFVVSARPEEAEKKEFAGNQRSSTTLCCRLVAANQIKNHCTFTPSNES